MKSFFEREENEIIKDTRKENNNTDKTFRDIRNLDEREED